MDITKFCAEEDGRYYYLTTPWVVDGWRYATDGIIAVRKPTDEPDTDLTKRPTKIMEEFFRDFPCPYGTLVPKHDRRLATTVKEPACLDNDDCIRIKECKFIDREKCTNLIAYRVPKDMEFAGHKWQGKYIELLNDELPGARYSLTAFGMRFVCGDVEGVLARMKGDADDA